MVQRYIGKCLWLNLVTEKKNYSFESNWQSKTYLVCVQNLVIMPVSLFTSKHCSFVKVKTSNNLEKLHYVMISFQSYRKNSVEKLMAIFDYCDIEILKVYLFRSAPVRKLLMWFY